MESPLNPQASPLVLRAVTEDSSCIHPQTATIIASALANQPDTAISVWQPRSSPLQKRSSKLKFYNSHFLDICDAVRFNDGSFNEVFVVSFVCGQETASSLILSLERLVQMADAVHSGQQAAISCIALHLSRLGRPKPVHAEIRAVFDNNELVEFIFIERLLTSQLFTTPIPSPIYLVSPPPVAPSLLAEAATINPATAVNANAYNNMKCGVVPRFQLQWSETLTPADKRKFYSTPPDWRCGLCDCRETAQRRKGPQGPLTLCNTCGIKWAKKEKANRMQQMSCALALPSPATCV